MRLLAALSGGVDSAVAAALAAEAGHQVTAVHMALMRNRSQTRVPARGCCSIEDASDARRSAAKLGLDFYVWDLSEEFEDLVVRDFLDTYAAGQTPNPCVRCNQFIKFRVLAERAAALGFDGIVTGHYARLTSGPGAGLVLRRARDLAKDQSYVLAGAGPGALSRCLFPLGQMASKDRVRSEAARRGLPVSAKPDSYDLCFVADGDTRGFLRSRLGERPGPILDQTGAEVGRHGGAYGFTIGQRRGLGLGRPAADGRPRYVTAVDTAAGVVRVGPASALETDRFEVREPVWFDPVAAGQAGSGGLECEVQVRAHGRPLKSVVEAPAGLGAPPGGGLAVRLAEPLRGLAPGQSAVFYDADRVLAHALIAG
ncbi:MAG: tRNA 2-thiouridine(34) synthase MnmA [Bifidobacteriaceae bacterium]|jgi:tRNA-specific 2-thiouridylase|nr:tRNA 2-thiouridine(34) synthase MnmA [Bifidobacteriaceae bacterium]